MSSVTLLNGCSNKDAETVVTTISSTVESEKTTATTTAATTTTETTAITKEETTKETTKETVITTAGCSHNYSKKVVAPTCAKDGYTLHTCSICGKTYKDNYKDANGHSYGSWKIIKEATTSSTGLKQRKCSVCGHVDEATINKKKVETPKGVNAETQKNMDMWLAWGGSVGKSADGSETVVYASGHAYGVGVSGILYDGNGVPLGCCSVCGRQKGFGENMCHDGCEFKPA